MSIATLPRDVAVREPFVGCRQVVLARGPRPVLRRTLRRYRCATMLVEAAEIAAYGTLMVRWSMRTPVADRDDWWTLPSDRPPCL